MKNDNQEYAELEKWESYITRAMRLEKLKKYKNSITYYFKALKIIPNDPYVFNKIGTVLVDKGEYNRAIKYFAKSLKLDRKFEYAWYNKGLAHYNLEQFKESIICFKNALSQDKSDADTWHLLGHCYFEIEKYDKATFCYSKEISIEPSTHSWTEKGNSLLEQEKYKLAMKCYEKAIKIKSTNNEALTNKGVCLYYLDKYENAINFFVRAIKGNKKNGDALHFKGHCHQMLEQHEDAIESFIKELYLDSVYDDTLPELGSSYLILKDFENARDTFKLALKDDANNSETWEKLAESFIGLGNYNEALKCHKKIKEMKARKGKTVSRKRSEHEKPQLSTELEQPTVKQTSEKYSPTPRKVFLIHGHDHEMKNKVSKYLKEKNRFPILLGDGGTGSRTILEQLDKDSSRSGYAVALFSPDDYGRKKGERGVMPRARQNVIFEYGYFIGKLGRDKVFAIRKNGFAKDPHFSDIFGAFYIPMDDRGRWKKDLAKNLGLS